MSSEHVLLTFVVGFLTFRIEFEQIEERTFVLCYERENCEGTSCTVIVYALYDIIYSIDFQSHCAKPKNKTSNKHASNHISKSN